MIADTIVVRLGYRCPFGAAHGFQPHRSPPATDADGASSADEILGS
jgi:hypothetical protein